MVMNKQAGVAAVLFVGLLSSSCSPNVTATPVEQGPTTVSPLSEWMGPLWNQSAEEEQYLRENRTRFEQNLIAECMLKQGFEYIPNLDATVYFDSPPESASARPDDIDWVTQYGYGIVSGITVGFDEFIPPPDPNTQLIESLSEHEREAFDIALNGPFESRFPPGAIELSGPELRAARANQGCAGMAEVEAEVATHANY